jgi:bifunctional non-homologous end joining protein LigD
MELIKPMLASPPKANGGNPLLMVGKGYTADIKLDGIRAIAYWDGITLKLVNRSMVDVTHRFPELDATHPFGKAPCILDGEIVAQSGSFQDTAKRDKQNKPFDVAQTMKAIPVSFVAFDLLHLGDQDLRAHPYHERRAYLDMLRLDADNYWNRSVVSDDPGFFDSVKALGMEGVIVKRDSSPYRSGRFSDWVKVKAVRSITCVATGYELGEGARSHFGAMTLKLLKSDGMNGAEFVDVGTVGTGFTASEITHLKSELDAGQVLLVEIECLNKTKDNKLRFPVYKGLRTDLSVLDAGIEQLETLPST